MISFFLLSISTLAIAQLLNQSPKEKIARKFEKEISNPLHCILAQRAVKGDRLAVSYSGWLETGEKFDGTEGKDVIVFELGKGSVIRGWEKGFNNTCAGENLVMIIPPQYGYGNRSAGNGLIPQGSTLFFKTTVEAIFKDISPAPEKEINEEGEEEIIVRNGQCRDIKTVKQGDKVTLKTVASLSSAELPGRVIPGDKIDESVDIVKLGSGKGVVGLEKGVLGACQGERRKIIVGPNLAFGERGVDWLVPPGATVVFDVTVQKVERDLVANFLKQISSGTFGGK